MREFLRHLRHRVIDGDIAVRVVFTKHFANHSRTLAELRSRYEPHVLHCVENAAMHWLQSVANIRERAPRDNSHRVVDVRLTHLRHYRLMYDICGDWSHCIILPALFSAGHEIPSTTLKRQYRPLALTLDWRRRGDVYDLDARWQRRIVRKCGRGARKIFICAAIHIRSARHLERTLTRTRSK